MQGLNLYLWMMNIPGSGNPIPQGITVWFMLIFNPMKKQLLFLATIIISSCSWAGNKDSTIYYNLPDSVKAVQYMAEINVQKIGKQKNVFAGIKTDAVTLQLADLKGSRRIEFWLGRNSSFVTKGINVDEWLKEDHIWFNYDWEYNTFYKLLIATAADSAANFSLYSGYIFLPKENKWKLIGTCRVNGRWNTLQQPSVFSNRPRKGYIALSRKEVWVQRQSGSWKNLKDENLPSPVINLFGHLDSTAQKQKDIQLIEDAIASGKTDVKNNEQGVYYTMLKEGTGRQVTVNDTVTVFYKGYLFSNDSVFDQTKDKPVTFPLKRLIKGWQTGIPLCKVGGKVKLVIPSDLGYSIRTRSAKIPPNSILVFEIEVTDAKTPGQQPGQ